MTQIRAIWRAAAHGVLAASALMALQGQVQAQTYGGYYGGGYYSGGYGGYAPTPAVPSSLLPPPPPYTATLTWSTNASSSFALARMTGTFSERITVQSTPTTSGGVSRRNQYTVDLAPTDLAFTGDFGNQRPISGRFDDTITWILSDPQSMEDVLARGGSFSLSGMRWQQRMDGSVSITGTVSAQNLSNEALWTPLDIEVFTVAAADVSTTGQSLTLDKLVMTPTTLDYMIRGLGLDPDGVQFNAQSSAAMNMGKLSMSPVPEPGTWSLWALGLVGIARVAGLRRRRH